MPDILSLLDTLDGLREDAADGCTPEHSDAGWCTWAKACLNDSPADTALVVALRLAYPRLAQALRAALTPTTDGERRAREALAAFDAPRCGRDVITGEDEERVWAGYCERPPGHDGACAMLGRCAGIDAAHLRTALALLATERAKARPYHIDHKTSTGGWTVDATSEKDAWAQYVAICTRDAGSMPVREEWEVCPVFAQEYEDARNMAARLDRSLATERAKAADAARERAAIVARVQAVVDTLTSNDTYNVGRRDALTWLIRELSPKVTP